MSTWKIAGVQMDCHLGEPARNLERIRTSLGQLASDGARLIVFPECSTSGYSLASRDEVRKYAGTIPGPTTDTLAEICRDKGVYTALGLLERDGDRLYNACALIGPQGWIATYRKLHLPCMGLDRFVDPGNLPMQVYDLEGLKIGIGICFDVGYPELPRVLALLGADLLILPTNWPERAIKLATHVCPTRALENHVYFMAVNRVGHESGNLFVGHSAIWDPVGNPLAQANHEREDVVSATIDPDRARRKRIVHVPGEYELDRINWRRPEFYQPLVQVPGNHPQGPHAEVCRDSAPME